MKIIFENGTAFEQPEQAKAVISPLRSGRDWRIISVIGTVDAVKAAFTNGAVYRQEWESTDAEGNTETFTHDLSDWSVAGEVVDHRDGTVSVLMGKPTEIEILQARLAAKDEELKVSNDRAAVLESRIGKGVSI